MKDTNMHPQARVLTRRRAHAYVGVHAHARSQACLHTQTRGVPGFVAHVGPSGNPVGQMARPSAALGLLFPAPFVYLSSTLVSAPTFTVLPPGFAVPPTPRWLPLLPWA